MSVPALSSIERRRHERYDIMAQVRVKRGRIDTLCELVNVSVSGALVDLGSLDPPRWITQGRSLEVHVIHPVDLDTIELEATVVRVEQREDSTRFACEFTDLGATERLALERLIALHAPAPVRPPPLPR